MKLEKDTVFRNCETAARIGGNFAADLFEADRRPDTAQSTMNRAVWSGSVQSFPFDSTGSYAPAFLVGASFNIANPIVVLCLIFRTRAGGGAPLRSAPA